jgi:hypothetical protein
MFRYTFICTDNTREITKWSIQYGYQLREIRGLVYRYHCFNVKYSKLSSITYQQHITFCHRGCAPRRKSKAASKARSSSSCRTSSLSKKPYSSTGEGLSKYWPLTGATNLLSNKIITIFKTGLVTRLYFILFFKHICNYFSKKHLFLTVLQRYELTYINLLIRVKNLWKKDHNICLL